jgi:excisionase family DNA binding protein
MQITPQDLWALRNIAIRAVNEAHEVFAGAARRTPSRGPLAGPAAPSPAPAPPLKQRLTYSLAEAVALIGLSRASLYRLIEAGELKAVRIGSRRLIEAAEIEALLARARQRD